MFSILTNDGRISFQRLETNHLFLNYFRSSQTMVIRVMFVFQVWITQENCNSFGIVCSVNLNKYVPETYYVCDFEQVKFDKAFTSEVISLLDIIAALKIGSLMLISKPNAICIPKIFRFSPGNYSLKWLSPTDCYLLFSSLHKYTYDTTNLKLNY